MGAVLFVFRSEFRRRWRSWLILVVLIAIVGGLALAAVAAGRRTASAFPRFVATHGYDAYIFNPEPVPSLARLPGVASVTSVVIPGYGQPTCACTHVINSQNFYINELTAPGLHRVVKLVSGRMPNPSSPDEVLASFNLQQDYGIHIGSSLRVPFYSSSQRAALNSNGQVAPSGPTVTLHVVGIAAAEFEFPSGQTPEYDLFTTPAFARAVNHRTIEASVYLVRLRHGTADLPRFAAATNPLHLDYVSNQDTSAQAVAASIHPQAVGWWILAALTTLAGLAVVGQGLGRQSVVESEEYPETGRPGPPAPPAHRTGHGTQSHGGIGRGGRGPPGRLRPLPAGPRRRGAPSRTVTRVCLRPPGPPPRRAGRRGSGAGAGPVALGARRTGAGRGQPVDRVPPLVDRGTSGGRRRSCEHGDRHPSRAGAGTGWRVRTGGYRAVRDHHRGHRPVCHCGLRRQPVAPDGHARALRPGLPDHLRGPSDQSDQQLAAVEHDHAVTGDHGRYEG